MEIEEVQRNIIEACLDENSFLVQLHSHANFDDDKYQYLATNISAYADLLGNSTLIDRHLAGCLFELKLQLDIALTSTFPRIKHPDLDKVRDAHYEVWSLLERIFTLPD